MKMSFEKLTNYFPTIEPWLIEYINRPQVLNFEIKNEIEKINIEEFKQRTKQVFDNCNLIPTFKSSNPIKYANVLQYENIETDGKTIKIKNITLKRGINIINTGLIYNLRSNVVLIGHPINDLHEDVFGQIFNVDHSDTGFIHFGIVNLSENDLLLDEVVYELMGFSVLNKVGVFKDDEKSDAILSKKRAISNVLNLTELKTEPQNNEKVTIEFKKNSILFSNYKICTDNALFIPRKRTLINRIIASIGCACKENIVIPQLNYIGDEKDTAIQYKTALGLICIKSRFIDLKFEIIDKITKPNYKLCLNGNYVNDPKYSTITGALNKIEKSKIYLKSIKQVVGLLKSKYSLDKTTEENLMLIFNIMGKKFQLSLDNPKIPIAIDLAKENITDIEELRKRITSNLLEKIPELTLSEFIEKRNKDLQNIDQLEVEDKEKKRKRKEEEEEQNKKLKLDQ